MSKIQGKVTNFGQESKVTFSKDRCHNIYNAVALFTDCKAKLFSTKHEVCIPCFHSSSLNFKNHYKF